MSTPTSTHFCVQFHPSSLKEEQALARFSELLGSRPVSNSREIKRVFNRLTSEEFGLLQRMWLRRMYTIWMDQGSNE